MNTKQAIMDSASKYTKKILDKLSGAAFFVGNTASKIQYFPVSPLTPVFILLSLLCYLVGYSLWLTACFFSPEQLPKLDKWYGFAQFKEQSSYAAFLGVIGALTALVALAIPVLTLPVAWIFFTSNVFWVIGEYHKYKNPPDDETYSAPAQRSFLYYALSVAVIGFISAATLTLIALFPPLIVPILIGAATLNVAATVSAFTFWYDYAFGYHSAPSQDKSSQNKEAIDLTVLMTEKTVDFELENTPLQEPYHLVSLFPSVVEHPSPVASMKGVAEEQTFSCFSPQ